MQKRPWANRADLSIAEESCQGKVAKLLADRAGVVMGLAKEIDAASITRTEYAGNW